MTQTVAGRGKFSRLVAGYGFGWLRRGVAWPVGFADLMGIGAPKRLLIAPQDIRTADPTMASDIYAGYFAFAGKMVNTHGRSPFETPPPSPRSSYAASKSPPSTSRPPSPEAWRAALPLRKEPTRLVR